MDQIGSGVFLLFLLVLVAGGIVLAVVVVNQIISKKKVDHTVEQSSAGVVLEDPETIEKKLMLEDKIEPLIPLHKDHPDHKPDIKFR